MSRDTGGGVIHLLSVTGGETMSIFLGKVDDFNDNEEFMDESSDLEEETAEEAIDEMEEDEDELDAFDVILNEIEDEEERQRDLQSAVPDIFGLKETKKNKSAKPTQKEFLDLVDGVTKKHKNSSGTKQIQNGIGSRKLRTGGTVSDFFMNGMQKVWEIDSDYQEDLIRLLMSEIRKIPDCILDDYVKYLRNMQAFMNANEDYMPTIFGESIRSLEYGVYDSEVSNRYEGRFIMPLRFLDNTVQGFVGWSPVDNPLEQTIKYLYPKKEILKKANVLFCTKEIYLKALRDGYICLTDGLFDAVSLNVIGINAASFCGSAITEFHKYALSKIKHKIIVPDNDTAGTKLLDNAKFLMSNVHAIFQTETKDIDDYLKDEERIRYLREEFDLWKSIDFIGNLTL